MIPEEHIPFFITEQLFVLDEQNQPPHQATAEAREQQENPKAEEPKVIQAEIIVICDRYDAAEKVLLSKILGAVKVNIDDIMVIEGVPSERMEYERLIVFGDLVVGEVGPDKYNVAPGNKWLRASSLSTLATSQEEKMKLWNALKSWFGLS